MVMSQIDGDMFFGCNEACSLNELVECEDIKAV